MDAVAKSPAGCSLLSSRYPMMLLTVLCLIVSASGCSQLRQPIPEKPEKVFINFRYEHPAAKNVAIVANFTRWTPRPMVRTGGIWSFQISLPPGRYLYAFLVDGQAWHLDPGAMLFDDDDFGKRNSVLLVE